MSEDKNEDFSRLLEEFRKMRGISQKQLAQNSDLSTTYISFLIRGERTKPSIEAVVNLAYALELDEGQRLRFFKAADHPSLFASTTSDLLSNSVTSQMPNAGRIRGSLAVQRSSIP